MQPIVLLLVPSRALYQGHTSCVALGSAPACVPFVQLHFSGPDPLDTEVVCHLEFSSDLRTSDLLNCLGGLPGMSLSWRLRPYSLLQSAWAVDGAVASHVPHHMPHHTTAPNESRAQTSLPCMTHLRGGGGAEMHR